MARATNFTTNTSITGDSQSEYLKVVGDGTWDGATLTLAQYNDDLSKYIDVVAWTADMAKSVHLGTGARWRLTTSGSSGSLDLDVLHESITRL